MSKCVRSGVTYKRHVWVDGLCPKCGAVQKTNKSPEVIN